MFLFSCWLHEIFIFVSLTASCRRFKCFYEGVVDILLYLIKGLSFPKTLDPKYLYLNIPQFARYPIFPKFRSSKTSVLPVPPVPPDTHCSQYSNFCVTFFFFSSVLLSRLQAIPAPTSYTMCFCPAHLLWCGHKTLPYPASSPGSACLARPWLFSFG